jgi:hypothetical protein
MNERFHPYVQSFRKKFGVIDFVRKYELLFYFKQILDTGCWIKDWKLYGFSSI